MRLTVGACACVHAETRTEKERETPTIKAGRTDGATGGVAHQRDAERTPTNLCALSDGWAHLGPEPLGCLILADQ